MSRHTANLCAASRDALASGVVRRAEAVQRACAATDEALRQADAIAAGAAARLACRELAAPARGAALRGMAAVCGAALVADEVGPALLVARQREVARQVLRSFPLEEHLSADCGDDEDEFAARGPSGGRDGDQQQGGDGPDAGTPAIIVRRGPKPNGNLDGGEGAQAQPEPACTASSGRRAVAPGGPCPRPQRALSWAKAALARGFGLCRHV
jgi:hypothetical protein